MKTLLTLTLLFALTAGHNPTEDDSGGCCCGGGPVEQQVIIIPASLQHRAVSDILSSESHKVVKKQISKKSGCHAVKPKKVERIAKEGRRHAKKKHHRHHRTNQCQCCMAPPTACACSRYHSDSDSEGEHEDHHSRHHRHRHMLHNKHHQRKRRYGEEDGSSSSEEEQEQHVVKHPHRHKRHHPQGEPHVEHHQEQRSLKEAQAAERPLKRIQAAERPLKEAQAAEQSVPCKHTEYYVKSILCHIFPCQRIPTLHEDKAQQVAKAGEQHPLHQYVDMHHLHSLHTAHSRQADNAAIPHYEQKVQTARIMLMYAGIPLDVLLLLSDNERKAYIEAAVAPLEQFFEAAAPKHDNAAENGAVLKAALAEYLKTLKNARCNASHALQTPVFDPESLRKLVCLREYLLEQHPKALIRTRMQYIHKILPKFIEFVEKLEPNVFLGLQTTPSSSAGKLEKIFEEAIEDGRKQWAGFPTKMQSATRSVNRHIVHYLTTGQSLPHP